MDIIIVVCVNVEITYKHPMSIFLSTSILYSLRQSMSLDEPYLSGLVDPWLLGIHLSLLSPPAFGFPKHARDPQMNLHVE